MFMLLEMLTSFCAGGPVNGSSRRAEVDRGAAAAGEGGVDAGDMEAGEGGGGGNLHKDLQLQGGPLRGSQQNLYPDINVIPPSRSRSPSASKSSEGEADSQIATVNVTKV